MIWEKRLVRAIDLNLSSAERRVTRQMTRQRMIEQPSLPANLSNAVRQMRDLNAVDDDEVLEVSEDDTVLVNSGDAVTRNEVDLVDGSNENTTASVQNEKNERNEIVARARPENFNEEDYYTRHVRRRRLPDGPYELHVDETDEGIV